MQPYFLPYIGYFQLIGAVDEFVVYDNIKYTKKGWINRNRLLQNGADVMFSLPLKKDSDSLDVVQRELATEFSRDKLLNQFRGAYARAPHFAQVLPLLEHIIRCDESNLFRYIQHSIAALCAHLGLTTRLHTSSKIDIDHSLKAQEKVLALCRALGARSYINPPGGTGLYDRNTFREHDVELQFIHPGPLEYTQFDAPFVPNLSIIDVLMFNPLDAVRERIASNYVLA